MKKLKELREAAGMSQQALAVAAGMSYSTIQKIESGKQSPTARKIEALAKALGVEVGELFAEAVA